MMKFIRMLRKAIRINEECTDNVAVPWDDGDPWDNNVYWR